MTDQKTTLEPWEEAQQAQASTPSQEPQKPMEPWEAAKAAQGLGPHPAPSGVTGQGAPSLQPQDWMSKTYHPLLEGGAMTGAAILAAPTAPETLGAGPVAAAIAAYPAGQQVANWIDQARGMQPTSQNIGQSLMSGAEAEAGGRVLGKAISMAAPPLRSAIVKSISSVFGPSTDAIEAWLQNPSLPNSPDIVALARKLPQTLTNLKALITQASDQAGKLLSDTPENAIPKTDITNIIEKQMDSLKTAGTVIGEGNKMALKKLQTLWDGVAGLPNDNLPQSTVKSIVKSLEGDINYADKGVSATNTVMANVQSGANKLLREVNPSYKAAMKEISGMMGILEDTQKAFGVTNEIGQGLQSTDKTITALQGINKNTRSISQDTLNDLAKLTGDDYVTDAQNAKWAQEFKRGATQGSRRVNLEALVGGSVGSVMGHLTGHPLVGGAVGTGAGAAAGALSDTYGGPIAKNISRLIQQLSQHMPIDLATRIVASAFAPQSSEGNQ